MDLSLLLGKRAAMGVAAVLLATGLAACGGDDEGGEEGDAPAAAAPGSNQTPNPGTSPNPNSPSTDFPPVISGTPITQAAVGHPYSFTPTAYDANGDAMGFSAVNVPSWAAFDPATGRVSGTPQAQHVGNFNVITISVTANGRTSSLPPYNIQVVDPPVTDSPPVISGTPPTQVVAGSAYSFTPTASDPNGDALLFTVVNLPSWASFNTSTGRLSGTPQIQHLGTYGSITIRVTANGKTASLPAFNIQVVGVGSESVTLTWLPPTQNEDGSALTDLAGYKIRYGLAPGSYTQTVTIPTPGLSSWQIDNLVKATYYFVISAYNSSGIESRYSNEASKSL